jgi:hypothetical protein
MRQTRKILGSSRATVSTPSGIDLPPDRAFVLQLDSRTQPPRRMMGRAEHITSGRVGHFGSLAELLAFLTNVLADSPRRE